MIGTGLIGALLTCIVAAAVIYFFYYLISPAQIPQNFKYALYMLIFIVVVIWVAKVIIPALGLSL